MAGINYAEQYARALAQSYPYVLNFGALYATENNGRYRMGEDGKTIYIPNISTTGRVAADRAQDALQPAQVVHPGPPQGHRPDQRGGQYPEHHQSVQRGAEVPGDGRLPDLHAL